VELKPCKTGPSFSFLSPLLHFSINLYKGNGGYNLLVFSLLHMTNALALVAILTIVSHKDDLVRTKGFLAFFGA
jgi:hypothetical protein